MTPPKRPDQAPAIDALSIRPATFALARRKSVDLLERNASAGAQALAGVFDAREKARIALQAIVEPVILRRKSDQDPCRFAMTGDDDLLVFGLPEIAGEIILDLRERHFLHSRFP